MQTNLLNDKRVINGKTDVNQLVPFKYHWAWEKYLAACQNHWMPQEISMVKDIADWKTGKLNDAEKLIVKRNLGFFTTADSLAANNIVLGTYRQITAPECRQYLLRQAFEEAIHCYIEGTEVLTSEGFKDFREITTSDLIAQWEDNKVNFVHPDEVLHDDYDGYMYRFENASKTYLNVVTNKHRCVAVNSRTGLLEIIQADKFHPSNYRLPVSGFLADGKSSLEAIEALAIAYQADGFTANSKTKDIGKFTGAVTVRFNLARDEKCDRLKHLAEMAAPLGVIFKETATVPGDALRKPLRTFTLKIPLLYAHMFTKDFSWIDITKVSGDWCKAFIRELTNWDGNSRKGSSVCYTNTNKEAVDKVVLLAHLSGGRAGVYQIPPSEKCVPCWQVHCHGRDFVSGRTVTKSKQRYTGKVHCVGVPSGIIITRYEGVITVSGNTHAYQYIVESLGLDEGEIFNAYNEIPSIRDKDAFLLPFIGTLSDPSFKTGTQETDSQFLEALIVFACLMEGLFFYVGFVQIFALGRLGKMMGASEQYQYILRDEAMHCNFGIDLINTIKQENPYIWVGAFKDRIYGLFRKAYELEHAYAVDTMPTGILGLNEALFSEYLKFIANRRLKQIGLSPLWNATNPFPWMSEQIDLKKEKNFFESRVTEYRTGGALTWD